MGMPILQANINHACQAQDSFLHMLAERDCGLGIVSKLYRPPQRGVQVGLPTARLRGVFGRGVERARGVPPLSPDKEWGQVRSR